MAGAGGGNGWRPTRENRGSIDNFLENLGGVTERSGNPGNPSAILGKLLVPGRKNAAHAHAHSTLRAELDHA